MSLSRLFSSRLGVLPLLSLLGFLAVLTFAPESPFRTFAPSDPDDYMRLAQVRDFLGGQNWFDVGQHRLSPGFSTDLHWSRLADLPLAGLTTLFAFFAPSEDALRTAALTLPLLLLAFALLPMAVAFARPLVARANAPFVALFLFTVTPSLLFNFTPGRVDHHAFQLLIFGFALFALPRLLLCAKTEVLAALVGVSFALGLWIGVEAVPGLALFAGLFTLLAAHRGGRSLRRAAFFGLALALSTVCELPLARPRADWFTPNVTWFSITYVAFALGIGFVCVALACAARFTNKRKTALFLLVSCTAFAFVRLFPQLVAQGPYADLSPSVAPFLLNHIIQTKPLASLLFANANPFAAQAGAFARYLLAPLLALSFFVATLPKLSPRRRRIGFVFAVCVTVFGAGTLFYQLRLLSFLQLSSLVLLTFALQRIAPKQRLAAFLALGPVSVMLFPVLVAGQPLATERLFAPILHKPNVCGWLDAAAILNDPTFLGASPHKIMNTMNDGPELLFRTPHAVLAAPYSTEGNAASLAFFATTDESKARALLEKAQTDVVVLCRETPAFYAGITRKTAMKAVMSVSANGHLILRNPVPSVFERLIDGKPPAWLEPIPVPENPALLIFRVRPSA